MKIFSIDHIICIVLVFFIMWLAPTIMGMFDFFEPVLNQFSSFRFYDIGYQKLGGKEHSDLNIMLINIFDGDKNNGEVNNLVIAKLIEKLRLNNPKVIGIDKILKENENPEYDEYLADVIKQKDDIVLTNELINFNGSVNRFDSIIKPDKIFRDNAETGYNNILLKDKRYFSVRYFFPHLLYGENDSVCNSFTYKLMEKYDPEKIKKLEKRNNKVEIINYLGTIFNSVGYRDYLTDEYDLSLDSTLSNKIVIIGKFNVIGKDFFNYFDDIYYTPMNEYFWGKAFPDMYRTQIYANILAMMLEDTYYTEISDEIVVVIAVLLVYINLLLFSFITYKNSKLYEISNIVIFIGESLLLFYLTYILYHQYRVALDLTLVLFAIVISIFVYEGYHESLKPIVLQLYRKFKRRRAA